MWLRRHSFFLSNFKGKESHSGSFNFISSFAAFQYRNMDVIDLFFLSFFFNRIGTGLSAGACLSLSLFSGRRIISSARRFYFVVKHQQQKYKKYKKYNKKKRVWKQTWLQTGNPRHQPVIDKYRDRVPIYRYTDIAVCRPQQFNEPSN